jgi:cytochrome c-type biogenesis protein CcmH/NrfG
MHRETVAHEPGWEPDYLHALDLMEARRWDVAREKLLHVLRDCRAADKATVAEMWCSLGHCHRAVGDLTAARDAWRLAASIDPTNARAVACLWDLAPLDFTRT